VTGLLVLVGGCLGAPTRYLVDRFVRSRFHHEFPLGTLLINVSGCLLLGIIAGGVAKAGWSSSVQALLGTGFCGGLTTFSTFSVEAVELMQGRRPTAASGYVLISCALGVAAAALGYRLA
jgi:CrcB protein